jgi:hypothetical protein
MSDIENEFKEFPNFDPTQDLTKAGQRRTKRGSGHKPLLESEIKDIQKKARSAREAARLLGVAYNTYKKYARQYGLFEKLKNPSGVGIRKGSISRSMYAPLDDILAGKYPKYPIWKLKKRLLLSGYMEEKCSCCGFDERRLTDNRVPLLLDFIDGNRTNHIYENLQMLCFNCYFLQVGNYTGRRKEYSY